jgi:predicted transposase YbfD/YdcC
MPRWVTQNTAPVSAITMERCPPSQRNAARHQRGTPSGIARNTHLSTLSSAEVSAREFARLVRQHWSIENSLHHVLDTTMAEDASRIRRNPGVFACLRQLALNLLRGNGERNISQALYRNALSLDKVLNYAGIWQK